MKKNNSQDLVSIIIPVYNAENFLQETIDSVLNQTYKNWELILVDDYSKDDSRKIILENSKKDNRIKYYFNKKNSKVAITRNNGISIAKGRYICFLDADDKWTSDKLEKQIKFIKDRNIAFSFTSYEFANENCIPNGKKVIVPETIDYKQALKNTTISTITVMFDMSKLSKKDIYMPNIKSEDTATWWRILKKGIIGHGMKDITAYYRRTQGTLSSNKLEAIKRIWNLYRKEENFNLIYSVYNFIFYAINAVKRRI